MEDILGKHFMFELLRLSIEAVSKFSTNIIVISLQCPNLNIFVPKSILLCCTHITLYYRQVSDAFSMEIPTQGRKHSEIQNKLFYDGPKKRGKIPNQQLLHLVIFL